MVSSSTVRPFPVQEEIVEAMAFLDLHRVSPRGLRDQEHFECLAIKEGCAISLPTAPAIGLNRILGVYSVEDLDNAYEWMRSRPGDRFLQLNMDGASDEMRDWIQARHLPEHGPGWTKLARAAGQGLAQTPSRVRTRRVEVDEAALFGSMMCEGFNFPPALSSLWSSIVGKDGWSCFFALDGQAPVGTGALFVSGSYAWLGGGATIPRFRNLGVQKALIQIRIEHATAQGVSTLVVETETPQPGKPNISYENLRKLGFQRVYDRKNFKL